MDEDYDVPRAKLELGGSMKIEKPYEIIPVDNFDTGTRENYRTYNLFKDKVFVSKHSSRYNAEEEYSKLTYKEQEIVPLKQSGNKETFDTGAQRDSQGIKHDNEKPPIGLIPRRALEEEARVMGFGEGKYDRHNWRKGMSWQRLVNALLRHALAYNEGEIKDLETGISHMAHIRCCAAFLLEYEETHIELNDLVIK